jgi:hypothetical protein
MRVRFGFIVGFAIGYVMGTKAGRERYQQLTRLYQQITCSQPAQQMSSEVREAATKAGQTLEQKANEGLNRVPGVGRRGDGDAAPPTPPIR